VDNLTQLVGMHFDGTFQRNMEFIVGMRQHRASLSPTVMAEYDALHNIPPSGDVEELEDLREHGFELTIVEYDPTSGLLLAKAHDFYGHSGVVGTIQGPKIEFIKHYTHTGGPINYEGTIDAAGELVHMEGTYQPIKLSKVTRGVWQMTQTDK
tara:strand:- start:236 stop:694 length:459 start_codon:yes stop_codon:yes gene_type:complete